jgi:hypothetical protein
MQQYCECSGYYTSKTCCRRDFQQPGMRGRYDQADRRGYNRQHFCMERTRKLFQHVAKPHPCTGHGRDERDIYFDSDTRRLRFVGFRASDRNAAARCTNCYHSSSLLLGGNSSSARSYWDKPGMVYYANGWRAGQLYCAYAYHRYRQQCDLLRFANCSWM